MINYRKLDDVHDLIEEIIEKGHITKQINFESHLSMRKRAPIFDYKLIWNGQTFTAHDIDQVIEKLEELNTPETKFKKGQLIWHVDNESDSKMHSFIVEEIRFDFDNEPMYSYGCFDDNVIYESEAFATKEDLIRHQLKEWEQRLNSCRQPAVCRHESHFQPHVDGIPLHCRKCGEFYNE